MNIFVMVDMEGISGICRASQVKTDGEHYAAARRFLTWDVNACVDGCIRGGATRVVVRDAHSYSYHFIWEELDERAEYIQGRGGKQRMPGIDEFDGLILLGYHAMAGTPDGVLEHTFNSMGWQNFWMNGRKAGEVAVDAAIAGENGVPTIMISGDDKVCKEAAALIKGIVTVQVKKGLGIEGAQLLPKERAHALIREGATKAVAKCKSIAPFKVKTPVKMRLELVSRGAIPFRKPGVKVIDGRTYEITAATVEEGLFNL